jgi:CHASE2 domain-containing sensor protein
MSSPVKVVVLELDGDCRVEPVRVRLELGLEGQRPQVQKRGELPPCPALIETLERWRDCYRHLGQINRALKPQEILYEGRIRPTSTAECRLAAQDLLSQFQQWLAVESFRLIDEQLREALSRSDSIQVSVQTQNRDLQRLPWHHWRFIERYPQAEVGLSAPLAELPPQIAAPRHSHKVRILAILGHSDGIDIETDQRLLNHIADAEVCFLPTPGRALLCQSLWEEPWDILFFAGHSETCDEQGRIYLSPQESLTLDELKNSLRRAIHNGLKLAIFNSCDGLGLAYELEQLHIPHMIVMREPVPDAVAQSFLKGFLQAFSRGTALYEAVREARERLEGIEGNYPCASWLPIIYENPTVPTLSWPSLKSSHHRQFFQTSWFSKLRQIKGQKLIKSVVTGLIAALVVIGLRMLGLLQTWELQAYDQMMRALQNTSEISQQILVITIDERDLDYQRDLGIRSEGSISDDALLMLLTKIEPYQPAVIGFDIIHDTPFTPELTAYFERHNNFIAICRADIPESDLPGVLPPSKFPDEKLGFINFPLDYDGVLRRQLLGMAADGFCPSTQSFSFKIATEYLRRSISGDFREALDADRYYLHNATFRKLSRTSGGYQLPPDEDAGFQILTDYKDVKIAEISLREILSLSRERLPGLVEGKVLLIGVDNPNKDRHVTPLVADFTRKTPGVIVHAKMTNTLLKAAYGETKTISWWPEALEGVWILVWAIGGALLKFSLANRFILPGIFVLFLAQSLICLYGMASNHWLPLVPIVLATSVAVLLGQSFQHQKS